MSTGLGMGESEGSERRVEKYCLKLENSMAILCHGRLTKWNMQFCSSSLRDASLRQ